MRQTLTRADFSFKSDTFYASEPVYTEDDLQALYANLLAHPEVADQLSIDAPKAEDYVRILQDVAQRLLVEVEQPSMESNVPEESSESLSSRLAARLSPAPTPINEPSSSTSLPLDRDKLSHNVLSRLNDIVVALERAPKLTPCADKALSVVLLSQREWGALVKLLVSSVLGLKIFLALTCFRLTRKAWLSQSTLLN